MFKSPKRHHLITPISSVFEDFVGRMVKNISFPVRTHKIFLREIAAHPASSVTNKSAIAVILFINLSGNPALGFFSDELAEELISASRSILGRAVDAGLESLL